MKCLILAAGYATRLYPITKNFPKPLLKVHGKTILDWLLDDINCSGEISEYIVISNHKFLKEFQLWTNSHTLPIRILDDGSENNETRLGAVRDIQFAIETLGLDDDLLVIAGDNLLDFSLHEFIKYAKVKKTTCIMRYWEPDTKKLYKTGIADVNDTDQVTSMEEKPDNPKSNWCIPPFYIYNRKDIPFVKKGISSHCEIDAPGSFISWLCKQTTVHAYQMPGRRFDIGNIESYQLVQKTYRGIE